MGAERKFIQLISGEEKGLGADLKRGLLKRLSSLYSYGVQRRNYKFNYDKSASTAAGYPVISVGNITAGGTGKTPMVRYLCESIKKAGHKPVVLTRGYKAKDNSKSLLVSSEEEILLGPEISGDEAYLLAYSLPKTPVIIGRSRLNSAALAKSKSLGEIFVLDDGFQHRQIKRDLDIVLIDATNPFGYDYVLPRGLLREPLENIKRADLLILTKARQVEAGELESVKAKLQALAPHLPLAITNHSPKWMQSLELWGVSQEGKAALPIAKKVVAMSGIGNPASFTRTLEEAKMEVLDTLPFGDHHDFTFGDLKQGLELAKAKGAEALVITEKDAVKLTALYKIYLLEHPEEAKLLPVYVVGIDIEFLEGEEKVQNLLQELMKGR